MIKFHAKCLSWVPVADAMYGRMSRILDALKDRLESYDKFLVNPYTEHAKQPKFNSDEELQLGEYAGTEQYKHTKEDK